MNLVEAYLLFVLMYGLVVIGLFVVVKRELKKIVKEVKGEKT